MKNATLAALGLTVCLAQFAFAGDWPQFRGPNGDGTASDEAAPTSWSDKENVKWKVALPRPGNGSPIVSKGRVFVTSAQDQEGKQRSLYCFNEADGEQLWVKTVELDKVMPTHQTNPYGGSTPASDGERVVVWHATAGLYCYDLDGEELWSRDLGEFKHIWGYGTSPIIHGGRIILYTGPGDKEFLTSLDPKTGKTIWETVDPVQEGGRGYRGSWSTPVVAKVEGKDQLILSLPTRVAGFNPEDGKIIWFSEGFRHNGGDLAYSSPVIAGDICFVTGGYKGPAMSVRLGGAGDVTETHRLWHKERQPQSIGSAVSVGGKIFRPNAGPGTIECIDPVDGTSLWQERSGGSQWASIVMAGGLLYATNQNGQTTVFEPNPEKFSSVSTNRLNDRCNATPAIANKHLFIRTAGHLWCVGE